MNTHSLGKRFLSLFLCIVFCFSLLPTAAFADDADNFAETQEEVGVISLAGEEDSAEDPETPGDPEIPEKTGEITLEQGEFTETDALTETDDLLPDDPNADPEPVSDDPEEDPVDPVAVIDDVEYTSLEEAVAAAQDGDTVVLLTDVTVNTGSDNSRLPINKSMTIDGKGYTISINNRGFGLGTVEVPAIDVTFKNVTIKNSSSGARCIDTRGHLNSLTLDHVTLDTNGASGYTQPLTIGGNQSDAAYITITDSTIQTNDEGTAYYAIITFNPVIMNITDSTIKGWACIYAKAANSSAGSASSVFNITGSTLVSTNAYNSASNAFAMFTVEDDDVVFNVSDSDITVNANSDQYQAILLAHKDSRVVCNIGERNDVQLNGENAVFCLNGGEVSITGGTFNVDPSKYVPEDYKAVDNGDGTFTVTEKPYVAQIGSTKYETLAEAVAAANESETIEILVAGEYTLPNLPQNIIIEGKVDGVVFNHTGTGSVASIPNGATFKNVAFNFGNNDYHGFQHAGTIDMIGCTLNGKLFSYADMNFTDCKFVQGNSDYHMWCYAGNITYTNCEFVNEKTGKFLNIYNEDGTTRYTVTVEACSFKNEGSSNKAALNIKETCGAKLLAYDVVIKAGNTTEGAFPEPSKSASLVVGSSLWQVDDRLTNGAETNITVTVGDTLVYPEYVATVTAGDTTTSYTSLQNALNAARDAAVAAGSWNATSVTVDITKDITFSEGETWTPVVYNQLSPITINGNDHTITNLPDMLYQKSGSGTSSLTMNGLTFVNPKTTTRDYNAVIMGYADSVEALTFNNVSISGANIVSSNYAGAFVGYSAGYSNVADGPVYQHITFNNCSVTGSTITGEGSVGALMGHAAGSTDAKIVVSNSTVSGNTITSTGSSTNKAGALFGTVGALGPTNKEDAGLYVCATVSGNTVTSNGTAITTIYGRQGTSTGRLTLTPGGSYDNIPIAEADSAWAGCQKDYELILLENGTYTVAPMPIIAKIGEAEYTSLQAAIDAAHEMTGDVTVTLIADTTEVALIRQKAGLNLTVDGGNHTLTGQLLLDGGGFYGDDTLTIQNFNFAYDSEVMQSGADAFVYVLTNGTLGRLSDTHNVTIKDSSFDGGEGNITFVAVKATSGTQNKNFVLENLDAQNLHSLAQLTAVNGITIDSCSGTSLKNGINISGGEGTGNITGNTLTAEGYTVRVKAASGMVVTLSGNTFSGGEGLKSEATAGGKIIVTSGKYAGPLPTDKTKFTVQGGVFTVAPAADVCAEGLYPVANTDPATKAEYPYTVGLAVAAVNGLGYATFAAAAEARESDDDVITLLADITDEYTLSAGQTLKVQKNGFSVTVKAPEGAYVFKETTDEGVTTYTVAAAVAQIGDTYYASLAEAVAAVPADGTETTITMIDNEAINVVGSAVTIPANKNIVLDLNGFQVVGTAKEGKTSALITNKGTLTIKDNSAEGTGKLISGATETWIYNGDGNYAGSYASNTITNSGTLTVESGYIENLSTGSATYAIDNNSSGADAITIINGGTVKAHSVAIREFANSTTKGNSVTVNGGLVEAGISGIWVQLPGSDATKAVKATLNVTGGEIKGGSYAFYDYSYGNSFDATQYTLSGGTLNGDIFSYGANIAISGGVYMGEVAIKQTKPSDVSVTGGRFGNDVYTYGDNASKGFITGGVFAILTYEYEGETYDCDWMSLIHPDYTYTDNTDEATKAAYPYMVTRAWKVTFDADGGEFTGKTEVTVPEGEKIEKPDDPTREGYTFQGWYKGETAFDFDTAITENTALTAKWEINKYTITFTWTLEGVAEPVVETFEVEHGQSLNSAGIPVPTPTDTNYNFIGFTYTDAEGNNHDLNPAAAITGPMTFVGQREGKARTIIYINSADNGTILEFHQTKYGEKTPAFEGQMPTREGYAVRKGDEWKPAVAETVSANTAYDVKWVKILTVSFDTDGGSEIESTTVLQGDPVAKPADPTKEGYTFKGWFNGEAAYDFTAPVNEDITLTAKWEINYYTVTFDTDGGSAIEAASVPYNTAVTRPADPTKENAVFGGWLLNGEAYDFETPVTANLTLKAFWAVAKNVETGKLYATLGEAMNEAENGQTVQLLGSVELTERLFVNAGADTVTGRYATTSENKSITLDLNGKNITSSSNIALAGGSLNIIGEGAITTTGSGLAPIEVRGTGDLSAKRTLTIGENVTLNGDYGLNVFGSNDEQKNVIDVTVDGTVNGTLFVLGNLANTANEINIVVNGTIAATGDDVGVALNGYANVTVNEGAKISGSCGVEVRAGKLDVTGGNITSNADATTVNPNGDGSATKGAAIAVAQHTTSMPIEVIISGGSISGVAALNVANPEGNTDSNVTISVSGGDFTGKVNKADERIDTFISGGRYNEEPNASYIVRGKCAVKDGDWWVITDAVAEIGTIGYGTLEAAFAAAKDGDTIKVLKDCSGNGIIAPQGKFATGLTVEFDGHTYDFSGKGVGSAGTQYLGFQLLKDNTITFKNGKLTASSEDAGFLIQNYSNLTLDGMTVDGSTVWGGYAMSNNNGNVVIKDSTITAPAGGFAFDVCRYSSYPSVNVTVTGSIINGNIEVSASGNDAKDGFSLMLESGTFNGAIVLDPSAEAAMEATPEKAAVKKNNTNVADNAIGIPTDYKWAETEDNNISKLVKKHYVAQIGEAKYESLAEAAAAAVDGDTIVMIDNSTETVRVRIEKSITLDLNGKTVSNTDTVMNVYKDFVVLDSSEEGTGKIESTGSAGRAMQVLGGTTTLKSGSLYGKQIAVLTYEGNFVMDGGYASGGDGLYALSGSITVNGGSVNVTGTAVSALNESTISITGGTVFGKNAGLNLCDAAKATINGGEISGLYGITLFDTAECVMNDGTVKATGYPVSSNFHSDKGFTFTINGGQLLQTDKDQPAIYMPGIGTVNINGGYIEGKYGVKMYHGVLNITGGTVNGLSESAVQIINTYWGANDLRSDADRVNYAQIPQVSISGGNMIGGGGHDAVVSETGSNTHASTHEVLTGEQILNFISGGWFSNEIPENFCAEGIIPDRNAHADAPDSRAQYTVKTGEYVAQNVQTGLKYETLAEAIAEAGENNTILLLKDIQETQNTISKDLTLNLNGKTLTGRLTADAGNVTVKNGNVIGRVDGYDNTNLVIDEDAKIQGQLIVWGDGEFGKDGCKTPTVTVKGEITNTGDAAISTNGTDKSGAKIIISANAKISSDDIAIYLPSGNVTVNGGEIAGATAIYQKSGSLEINGGTITGNGAKAEYSFNGNGASATGDAIVVESCGYPNGAPVTNIYGGTLNTSNGLQVGYYENNDNAEFADVYAKDNTLTIPEDYKWVAQSDELYKLTKKHYVAQNVETEKKYETLTEAVNAADEGQTVKLLENLTDELSEYVIINNDKAFSIDLAGYTANGGISLKKGQVSINNGKITDVSYGMPLEVTGFKQSESASNSLTLGEDVTVRGTWGLILWNADGSNDGYGSTININGKVEGVVFVSGNLYQGDSVINVKGNIESEDHGIALNGYAIVNVEESASIISGETGIEVRAGELNVSGGIITGNGSEISVKANGSGTTTDGAGIAVAQHNTKLPIKINVTGGTITGAAAFYESNPQNNAEADLEKIQVSITGGNFFGTGTEAIHAEDLKDFVSAVKTGEEITNRPWASSKINETYVADPYTASNEMEHQPPFTVSLARTVTFDANGGELTLGGETKEKHEIVLPDGETVTKPETDPTKEGYHFLGWYNGEDEYNFETPVTSDITLKAKWEINVYTVTFTWNLEGVAEPVKETYTVEHGQSLNDADITVPAPTDTNYNFIGFIYTDETGNHNLDPEAPITGNMIFIGQWDNKTYLVVYTDNADNGKILESYSVKYLEDTPRFQGQMPTRDGYAIREGEEWTPAVAEKVTAPVSYDVNWVKILNVTFVNDAEQSKITVLQGDKITAPEQPTKEGYTFQGWFPENSTVAFDFNTEVQTDLVLTATWKANEYTITFMNGETEVAKLTQDYGTTVIAPEDPTKEGYSFKGWAPALPATMPAENLTVEATWEINQYTITFVDGENEIEKLTQDYGTAVTAPADPTKEGYTFKGWDTEIPATMPAEDLTIKATWETNQYTITFMDGETELAKLTQDYGTTVTAPADPTKEGYTFKGWDAEIPATMPAEDLTITAKWEINQYTITFDTDGGSEIAPITQDYGTAVTAPADPTKEGYTFKGWDTEIPATMPAENLTIKATWEIKQYTITFMDGETELAKLTQDYGTTVTAPADPTKEGYTFKGWDTEIPATMPAKNLTIKATWETKQYTITFMDGEAELAKITQDYGTTVMAPEDPTKEGYTFKGWDTEIPATMPAEDLTIKATWEIKQYTVTFDTDGGSAIEAVTVDHGQAVEKPEDPTKDNAVFGGWLLNGAAYDFETPVTDNLTLKASWAEAVAKNVQTGKLYTTLGEAMNEVQDGQTVQLLANVELTERLFVNAGAETVTGRYATTSENKSITLDLNGKNITSSSNIALAGGSLNIIGEGAITTTGSGLAPIEVRGTGDLSAKRTLTIGENVTLNGDYGLNVFGSNDEQKNVIDVTVDGTVNGTLFVLGNLKNTANEINIVVNGTIAATGDDVGVALNGYANVTVNEGAKISGSCGVEVRAGKLDVTGGNITSTADATTVNPNGDGSATKGAAIAVAQHTTNLPIEVSISGGNISGSTALNIANPEGNTDSNVKVSVSDGVFNGAVNNEETRVTKFISGGYFRDPVLEESCAEGYVPSPKLTEGEYEGMYTVTKDQYVAMNLDTGVKYTTLNGALAEAKSGETVVPLTNITNEAYILVMSGITLDLNGFNVTNATLFYVTGTLVDHGETRGQFSAQAYHLGQSVNSEFPIYNSETDTYSLYDLGVRIESSGYRYRLKNTPDREAAVSMILSDQAVMGRVVAAVRLTWQTGSGETAQSNVKTVTFANSKIIKYYTAYLPGGPRNLAIEVAFSALEGASNVVATPMFIVYDANGAEMMTLDGTPWQLS